jgi:lysozyme
MKINAAAIALIKEFEGFRAETYLDSAGIPTIGYGTTAAAGVGIVPKPGMRISEPDAEEYLHAALSRFAAKVAPLLKREPTENQYGAMMSLAYNIGPGAFSKSSVLRRFNAGDIAGAADAFLMWNKATVGEKKVVLRGLVRRREAERALFLSAATHTAPNPAPATSEAPTGLLALILRLLAAIFGRKPQ